MTFAIAIWQFQGLHGLQDWESITEPAYLPHNLGQVI